MCSALISFQTEYSQSLCLSRSPSSKNSSRNKQKRKNIVDSHEYFYSKVPFVFFSLYTAWNLKNSLPNGFVWSQKPEFPGNLPAAAEKGLGGRRLLRCDSCLCWPAGCALLFHFLAFLTPFTQVDAHRVILAASSPFFKKVVKKVPHNHPLIYLKA